MCGFVGVLCFEGLGDVERESVSEAGRSILHRGPDDHSVYSDEGLHVEFRRLAIQDVVHGRQPFSDPEGRFVCFMNGEIYNFREIRRGLEDRGAVFQTECDTEVIPHLLALEGLDGLRRLNGMFAIMAFDTIERRLYFLRDPFGIKPLYVSARQKRITFGSELKCFLPLDWVKKRIDDATLSEYRLHLFALGTSTPFDSIRNLPPGCLVDFSSEGTQTRWRIDAISLDEAELPEPINPDLESAICAAVDRQVIADVPVGLSLSGGIDSGLLAGAMREIGRTDIKAYHIEGQADLSREDTRNAKRVADHLGIDLEVQRMSPDRYWDTLPQVVWMLDEPIGDPAALSAFEVARLAGEEVRVLLMGTGGDELFHGYGHMRRSRRTRLARFVTGVVPGATGVELARRLLRIPPGTEELVVALASFEQRPARMAAAARTIWPGSPSTGLEQFLQEILDEADERRLLPSTRRMEVRGYLEKQLLPLSDRSAMASSVEGRVPLLDLRFWTDSRTIADETVLADRRRGKPALRDLAAKWLPPSVVNARKSGFTSIVESAMVTRLDLVRRIAGSSPVLRRIDASAAMLEWSRDSEASRRNWLPLHAGITLAVWESLFVLSPVKEGCLPSMVELVDRMERSGHT